MTVGMCSCEVGKDGSPCKHQYVLWCSNLAHCINFVPVAQPDVRQKLAWIAIGESLPLSHYQPLRDQASKENEDSDCLAVPVSADAIHVQYTRIDLSRLRALTTRLTGSLVASASGYCAYRK